MEIIVQGNMAQTPVPQEYTYYMKMTVQYILTK